MYLEALELNKDDIRNILKPTIFLINVKSGSKDIKFGARFPIL